MAVHNLGMLTFEAQRDYGGSIGNYPPSLPWKLQFLYDDQTDNRSAVANNIFPAALSTLPPKIYLFEGNNNYCTIQSNDYKRCRGTSLEYYLQNLAEPATNAQSQVFLTLDFPFFSVLSIPNHYECAQFVCDIKIQGEPKVQKTTGVLTNDGEIQVTATSSASNIQYAIQKINQASDPNNLQGVIFQTSNLFTNLFAGLYRIYAKDKNECLTQVNVEIGVKEEDFTNTRLFFEFDDNHSQLYRVNIVERDNSGQTTEIKAVNPPFIMRYDDNDNIFRRIVGSIIEVNLKNTTNFQFLTLFDKEDKFYRADIIKDPNGTPLTIWSGFLVTNQYNEPFKDAPYPSTITFNDGLGELKHLPYRNSAGEPITGLISRFEMLLIILRKLEIDFNVRVIVDLESETETFNTATQTTLHIDYVDQEAYMDNNCEEVLQDLCFRYNARIHSKDGFFWFQRIVDNVRPYDYLEYGLDGNFVSKQTIDNYKIIQRPENDLNKDFYVETWPTLRQQTGVKSVKLTRPSHARENVLINGDFENNAVDLTNLLTLANIEGWTAYVDGSTSTSLLSINSLENGENDKILRIKGNSKDSRVFSREYNITNFKGDRLKFSFSYNLFYREGWPFVKLKWRVKWGDRKLSKTGDWIEEGDGINTIYVSNYSSWQTFSVEAGSWDQIGVGTPGVFQVEIWAGDISIDLEDNSFSESSSVTGYLEDQQIIVDTTTSNTNYGARYQFWKRDGPDWQKIGEEWSLNSEVTYGSGIIILGDEVQIPKDNHTDINNVNIQIFPNGNEIESEFITEKDNELNFFPNFEEEFLTGSLPRTSNLVIGVNPPYQDRDKWIYDYFAKNSQGVPIFRFKRPTSTQFQVMEILTCDEILTAYKNNYWILDASIFSKGVINFTNAIVDLINPVTDLGGNVFEGKIYLLGGMEWEPKRAVYKVTLIEMGLAQVELDVDPGDSNVEGKNARVTAPKDPLAPSTQGAFSSGFSSGFEIKN